MFATDARLLLAQNDQNKQKTNQNEWDEYMKQPKFNIIKIDFHFFRFILII